jgi:AcrR family transcriptional regulator
MSRSAATRQRILEAARRLLDGGDTTVSMSAIAKEAGVTRQLLYVHFASRADLLVEVTRLVDAEVRDPRRQARIDNAADGVTALHEAIALQGFIKPRIRGVAAAIGRLAATDPDAAAAWAERERARFERCADVVARLQRESVLDPRWQVATAARLLWSTTSQRAWSELIEGAGWTTRAWVQHTTALVERALLRPSPQSDDHLPAR